MDYRQDRQDRVFEALDTATKPIQIANDIGKLLFLVVALLVAAIGTPIYLLCTGQPVPIIAVELAGLAIMFVFTLCYAPWYMLIVGFGGTIVFGCALENPAFKAYMDDPSTIGPIGLVFTFLLVGIIQSTVIRLLKRQHPEDED
jgi:hypothetical protein